MVKLMKLKLKELFVKHAHLRLYVNVNKNNFLLDR